MDRGAGEFEGVTQVVAEQQAREEQPRGQVADPDRLPREGQQRALQVPGLIGGHQQHLEGVAGLARIVQVLYQDCPGTACQQAPCHFHAVGEGVRLAVAEAVQLQLVGAQVVGDRGGFFQQEVADLRGHDAAFFRVAHDRVAEVQRPRVGLFDPCHHIENGAALGGAAEIAGQHRVAVAQFADAGNTVHQRRNLLRRQHLPGPSTVLGVVGELHRVQRPDVDSDALHREHRRGIAGVAEDHMGLDGEQVGRTWHETTSYS